MKKGFRSGTLDECLTKTCLEDSVADVVRRRERTTNAKAFFICDLIMSAIFEFDMNVTNQIINRLDGPVPCESERDNYANIVGGAIEDVLELDSAEQFVVRPTDPVIIGIAKVIYVVATSHPKKGSADRKDKQLATEIMLNRVGGRKDEPTRVPLETKFVEPEWMESLGEPTNPQTYTESTFSSSDVVESPSES